MQINEGRHGKLAVPHGMGPASRMWLADVFAGRKARYTFVLLANSSRDARARVKRNALAALKEMKDTQTPDTYRKLEERTEKLWQILAAIKNNKIKITELGSCRVYPVADFDDPRIIC